MSLKSTLIGGLLAVVVISIILLGVLGAISISQNVIHEAQQRVNHDLNTSSILYEQLMENLADRLSYRIKTIVPESLLQITIIQELKEELNLTLLNICDVNGHPISGNYPDRIEKVPISRDPVIRQALEGKLSWGTVLLDKNRLYLEGGEALANAMQISPPDGNEPLTSSALFLWVACPLKDSDGQVVMIVYGGRALNYNYQLVDELRDLVFGKQLYKGKPLGTVTIFLDGIRVATNVLGPTGTRAIGTKVSLEVQKKVLQQGEQYNDRAIVVDTWYLSAYKPLYDPNGRIIGMLYTGLLEAPYTTLKLKLLLRFLIPTIIIVIIAVVGALLIVSRIIKPLSQLSEEAKRIARGEWKEEMRVSSSYREIKDLVGVFSEMRTAISERDFKLREQNRSLALTNQELEQANRNYMQMLGFVTHELKSPLATMQTMSTVMLDGLAGEVSEKVRHFLIRIKKTAEELQDMVKNYLDLSRAERGELVAEKKNIDFRKEVVDACVSQTRELFNSRRIKLEVHCPENLHVLADPELMRIALSNYLTNAAKYGDEGGRAVLEVIEYNGEVKVSVWNTGQGFTDEEGKKLFSKFVRLRNKATQDKRGSGLGLFLCKQVIEQHKGRVWAESQPGEWARFSFIFPLK